MKRWLSGISLAASIPFVSSSCETSRIKGKIVGANASTGHRLRTMDFSPPKMHLKTEYIIVGGGIAGLSAARYLRQHTSDFLLLEMNEKTGGNSEGGSNAVSAYPWGAHYLPIPGNSDPELLSFLQSCNVITGFKNGLPLLNEYYLCHDPKERLFIHHQWQEGLIPNEGLPSGDRTEIRRFLDLMDSFKHKNGRDGRRAFAIPSVHSSMDQEFRQLTSITADDFLRENNFTSQYLRWYVQYCCADDFGSGLTQTSAWAMVHYFAARNGKAVNASADAVLTWPEGNAWLANELRKTASNNIVENHLAFKVDMTGSGVVVYCFDTRSNKTVSIEAKRVIMATPQFVNQRLLACVSRKLDYTTFTYAPWMVANITTDHSLNERRGEGLCWDNVIYGSDSLGYINANHQSTRIARPDKVITYYKPLLDHSVDARRKAFSATHEDWTRIVLGELSKPHPKIRQYITQMDIWVWGHGMITPSVNLLSGTHLQDASSQIDQKIFFAHSDLSGFSIFEEAFYHGHRAAKEVLNHGSI